MRLLGAARNHEFLVGLVLLGIVAFSISAYVAMAAPPLSGPDERSHAAYAIALMHGDLPTIDTPVLDDPERFPQISAHLDRQGSAPRRDVWTANHPPLYYLISVPLLAVADWSGQPGAGLLAMRLLNAFGVAIGVVLVGLTARELVPRRPAVTLLATVLAVATAPVLAMGSQIFNDGLGNAASALTLLAGIRMLKYGPSRGRIVLAALAGTAAVGFRAPGVFAVALCACAAFYAAWRAPQVGAAARRWLVASGAAAVVAGVPALAFGWFYARNIRLYGDIGATAALLDKFDREPLRRSLIEVATDPLFYVFQFRSFFLRGVNERAAGDYRPLLWAAPRVLLLMVVIGLMVSLLVSISSRKGRPWPRRELVLAWVMMAVHAALIEYSLMSFYLDGGSQHARYTFPMLPLMLTVTAVGLLGLVAAVRNPPGPRLELLATVGWSALLLVAGFGLQIQVVMHDELDRGPFLSGHTTSALGYGSALTVGIVAALAFLVWLGRRVPVRSAGGEPVPDGGAKAEPGEPSGLVSAGQAESA